MLCPEVWKFSPPESNFKETSGHFRTSAGDDLYIPPPLKDFYYTHLVIITNYSSFKCFTTHMYTYLLVVRLDNKEQHAKLFVVCLRVCVFIDCLQTRVFIYIKHLQVSVVLPNALNVPGNINESLSSDCDYYKIENLSLAELVSEEFIRHFVRKGSLTALSIERRIDIDNCACVTPDGSLILTLDRKSFQELGLEGKVSQFASKKRDRYSKYIYNL